MKIIGVHGIFTQGASIDSFLAYQAAIGHRVLDLDLVTYTWWDMRFPSRRVEFADALRTQCDRGDIILAHSAGCLIAFEAMQMGAIPSTVIFMSPAISLAPDFLSCRFGKMHVFSNERDNAILIGQMLLAHPFGRMGRTGYKGDDPRVLNHRYRFDPPGPLNHSWDVPGPREKINDILHDSAVAQGFTDCSRWLP